MVLVPLWSQCVCQQLEHYILMLSSPEEGKESASAESVGQGS